MNAIVRKNWPGFVSIALAVASGGAYVHAFPLFQLGTISSLGIGSAAVYRARRGGGGFASAMAGLVLGGILTLLWVVWIGGLILNPGALGD